MIKWYHDGKGKIHFENSSIGGAGFDFIVCNSNGHSLILPDPYVAEAMVIRLNGMDELVVKLRKENDDLKRKLEAKGNERKHKS